MRVNTAKSIALGERIHDEFGSWDAALKAAKLRDGVYVLPPKSAGQGQAAVKTPLKSRSGT